MKIQLNEIKRMQQLAGLLKENSDQSSNKYIDVATENNDELPILNKETITTYLKSVIDPEEIENVDSFMFDDSEGWEETVMNGVDSDAYETMSEKDVEELIEIEVYGLEPKAFLKAFTKLVELLKPQRLAMSMIFFFCSCR